MAFFLAFLGVHKFAQGNPYAGVVRLVINFTCVGYFFNLFMGWIEAVKYLGMTNEDYTRDYLVRKKNWF
jgi:TM2 domain-containing membrane protein YozV